MYALLNMSHIFDWKGGGAGVVIQSYCSLQRNRLVLHVFHPDQVLVNDLVSFCTAFLLYKRYRKGVNLQLHMFINLFYQLYD